MQEIAVSPVLEEARVESYAGYKGEETPRAVVLDGKRFVIASVLSRKRVLDSDSGRVREVWRCRLEDGRTVTVERPESGIWRVSTAAGAPGLTRGSTSAVLARGYKPRASGEPKARPLTSI